MPAAPVAEDLEAVAKTRENIIVGVQVSGNTADRWQNTLKLEGTSRGGLGMAWSVSRTVSQAYLVDNQPER